VKGLTRAVYVCGAGDGSHRLFILEKNLGEIRIYKDGKLLPKPFLSLRGRVSTRSEQGLLGLCFHPQYKTNRRFFVYYTNTEGIGNSVLSEFHTSASDPDVADPAEKVLLTQKQPYENHNGGMITFGPDGYLYLGLGDGGAANDPHQNGQNTNVLLAKILRLDINTSGTYTCPPDNPFAGDKPGRDEIFAYGMRNPWRFSFDRGGDHRLFCGDVGQNMREEVDIISKGGNYGWRVMEGIKCFRPIVNCDQTGKTLPIFDYVHKDGNCSITGGYVYHGRQAPSLTGKYIYADYCTGKIWALSERSPGQWNNEEIINTHFPISSFGEDDDGELYVVQYANSDQPDSAVHRFVQKLP
jgi:glucose/arabinose dehydrogenase